MNLGICFQCARVAKPADATDLKPEGVKRTSLNTLAMHRVGPNMGTVQFAGSLGNAFVPKGAQGLEPRTYCA